MNLQQYFDKPKISELIDKKGRLAEIDSLHQPDALDIKNYSLAIIGTNETRNSAFGYYDTNPDTIRKYLYNLRIINKKQKIIDLGNLKQQPSYSKTYQILAEVTKFLIQNNITLLIIGGSQDLTFALYKGMSDEKNSINITTIDYRPDISDPEKLFNSNSFISHIAIDPSQKLFLYSNIAHQDYFTTLQDKELSEKLLTEKIRLGTIRDKIEEAEPAMRYSDIVSFDMSAIKQSEAPGTPFQSPNGLYSEEACQLARYAGFSDSVSCFGIFDYKPANDINESTAHLAAQIAWFFIEGVFNRTNDFPKINIDKYKKFIVSMHNYEDITFYKSHISDKWWIAARCKKSKEEILIPCTYDDYKKAANNEIPERLLNFVNKYL